MAAPASLPEGQQAFRPSRPFPLCFCGREAKQIPTIFGEFELNAAFKHS
jgi:hypothetical protein